MKSAPLPYIDFNLNVTGPYLNKKQGRRFVTITNKTTGSKTQKTYAKYVMEVHLGRELSKEETVDHIDRNKLNDVLSNYRVICQGKHSAEDHLLATVVETACVICGVAVTRRASQMRTKAKRNQAGPFCGPSCRGKYAAQVTHGGDKLPAQPAVETEFYYPVKKPSDELRPNLQVQVPPQ